MENHHNCPTCRYSLIDTPSGPAGPVAHSTTNQQNQQQNDPSMLGVPAQGNNEIFRFNGNRWLSWLPTIQVVHERRNLFRSMVVPQELIQRVQDVLPHVPAHIISQDLMQTHSVELTIENIIEGRIPIIPNQAPMPEYRPINTSPPISVNENTHSRQSSVPPIPTDNDLSSRLSSSPNVTNTSLSHFTELPKLADVFSSNPTERQQRLSSRKQQMKELARKQFLEKKGLSPQTNAQENSQNSEDYAFSNVSSTNSPIQRSNSHTQISRSDSWAKNSNSNISTDTNLNSSIEYESPEETIERRRKLMLEAAQKRFQGAKKDQ